MDMKKWIYLLLMLMLCACSRSMYYAYEDKNVYATLEVKTKKKLFSPCVGDLIYRGYAKKDSLSNLENISFFYMEVYGFTPIDKIYDIQTYSFGKYLHKDDTLPRFYTCLSGLKSGSLVSYVSYQSRGDSILLLEKHEEEANKDFCYQRIGLNWFPNYFVRIDKIDYTKFNVPELKHKYLRDPMHRNAPHYDKKWEDKQKKKAKKEERRKEKQKE